MKIFELSKRFLKNEAAATAIEYGLISALIAVVLITVLSETGTRMSGVFSEVSSAIR